MKAASEKSQKIQLRIPLSAGLNLPETGLKWILLVKMFSVKGKHEYRFHRVDVKDQGLSVDTLRLERNSRQMGLLERRSRTISSILDFSSDAIGTALRISDMSSNR